MSQIIFLVGARAAGKTTIGQLLAQKLNYTFVDTDVYLLNKTQKTVADIVKQEGWEGFRQQESAALQDVCQEKYVIATGGGMVLSEHNRDFMKQKGTVLYLSAPAHELASRLKANPNVAQRPSLTGLSIDEEMEKVLTERHPLYLNLAHHVIDATKSEDAIIKSILLLL